MQNNNNPDQRSTKQYGYSLGPSYSSYGSRNDMTSQAAAMDIFAYSRSTDKFGDHAGDKRKTNKSHLGKSPGEDNEPDLLVTADAQKSMAEISIPGMRAVFGSKGHFVRKLVWMLILLASSAIAGMQVYERVQFYLSVPIAVNVRVSRNDSLRFPVLTLCNKNAFNMSAINILREEKARLLFLEQNTTVSNEVKNSWSVPDLIGIRGMDALELWEFLAHRMEIMTSECFFGRNVRCSQIGRWERIHTYMGTCYSFITHNTQVSLTGMFNNLYLKVNESESQFYANDEGWKMLVHDAEDAPIIDVRTHGSTLYRGWGKDVRIYIREFKTLSTPTRPCNSDPEYNYSDCVAQCFIDAVSDRTNCSLPFMAYKRKGYPKRICNSTQSYKITSKVADSLLFYGHWSSNNCTCMRQCQEDIYIQSVESTLLDSKIGKLRIFYQDLTYDDIEEDFGYGVIPLLCDIGGSLGLLLGASLLTFFEIIEAMFAAVFHFLGRLVTRCTIA